MMSYGNVSGIEKPISRLVQGSIMMSTQNFEAGAALFSRIVELGCTCFDTAHVYGNGDVERAFGRWLNQSGLRDKIVILGKGAHHSQDRKRVTPFDISADIHDSLARMQVSYIDLYVLHRDNPELPVGPIVEVLNEHKAAGRIHAFGGSNWAYERVQEANAYAQAHGLTPFAVSSPNFSLADQKQPPWDGCISISGPRHSAARDFYQRSEMPLFTWSSLAGGFFSGRLRRDNIDTFETYLDKLAVTSYASEDNFQRLERAQQLGEQKGLSIPQMAMAYVMSQPLNIFALVGCQSADEFEANAKAADMHLSEQECAWLDLRSDSIS